ncbi:hypothetical protein BCO9919_04285 [Burkholderia cenocepacia]|uniref:Lipoprotein n=1 Tax=Burkholderia cenocepacia TaxID=95486 RepID=A0A6J5JG03_9BURK|nr:MULTISPECIES: hypothetical protein [Burkholderia cepacia complex]CAB3970387.1 hypothetical protein BCO9919_04285 [Burkholderia cenocepacia]
MKFLRTLILLLLCAVLPISGLAASGLAGECPMMQQGMSMSMSMSMDMDAGMSADTPGCDSMQSSSAGKAHAKAKGTACKLTAQCQFGSLYHPAARAEVSRPAAFASTVAFHYAQILPVRDPNGLWRPPRIS